MCRPSYFRAGIALGAAWLLAAPFGATAGSATTAEDVCPSTQDPCEVREAFQVPASVALDFGLRTVRVTDGGRFEFQGAVSQVLCGSFESDASAVAIVAGNPDVNRIVIEARRSCADSPGTAPCLTDSACDLGSCSVRRCAEKASITCAGDSSCQGQCYLSGRCSNSLSDTCQTNADCDFGPCPTGLSCWRLAGGPVACTTNSDCNLGLCSVGAGSISMTSGIVGRTSSPPTIDLRAADSISILGDVSLSSIDDEWDGGELSVTSYNGDVELAGNVRARSGRLGLGGLVTLDAAGDVDVTGSIDVSGGDFGGGFVEILSGGNTTITNDIRARSSAGAGYGGDFVSTAGGNIEIGGGTRGRLRVELDGHTGRDEIIGDGGWFDLLADGDVVVHEDVRIRARAGRGDAWGGLVTVRSRANVAFDADVNVRARGLGRGGSFEVDGDGTVAVGAASRIDARGGGDRGGDVYVGSGMEMVVAADVDVRAPGIQGYVDLVSDGALTVTGTLRTGGAVTTLHALDLDACRISIGEGATLQNDGPGATTRLRAHESMSILAGAVIRTPDGTNTLLYRTSAKPPWIAGTVTPDPVLTEAPSLPGCPVCGNSEIDQDEACDDGNTAPGDGCDGLCQLE